MTRFIQRVECMRVLLIEDDEEAATMVATGLASSGHAVDHVADGAAGLSRARQGIFDVLVVDRMMPELDGLSMVRSLRQEGVNTPVLFMTALGAEQDRVAGLEQGGDDYLVKPFSFAELNARVNILGRRAAQRRSEKTVLDAHDLVMDRLHRTVRRGGRSIDLMPLEFALLEFLMLHRGEAIPRLMLLEQVWNLRFDPGTNIVETHVSRLRAKLEEGESGPPLIVTKRGAGYMIRAD